MGNVMIMNDAKVVAYGKLDEDDERLITNYLVDKGLEVSILTVDPDSKVILRLQARIAELEAAAPVDAEPADAEPADAEPEDVDDG